MFLIVKIVLTMLRMYCFFFLIQHSVVVYMLLSTPFEFHTLHKKLQTHQSYILHHDVKGLEKLS